MTDQQLRKIVHKERLREQRRRLWYRRILHKLNVIMTLPCVNPVRIVRR